MEIFLPKTETGGGEKDKEQWEAKAHASSATEKEQIVAFGEYFAKLSKKLKELDGAADVTQKNIEDIKEDIEVTKESTKQATTFMMTVAGVIIIAFFLAAIPIFLDYLKNNEDRYEKVTDKLENYFTKEEINGLIKKESDPLLQDFKNCILQNQGYWPCLTNK